MTKNKAAINLASMRVKHKKKCEICTKPFIGYSNKRFCSDNCRLRNHRIKKRLQKKE